MEESPRDTLPADTDVLQQQLEELAAEFCDTEDE